MNGNSILEKVKTIKPDQWLLIGIIVGFIVLLFGGAALLLEITYTPPQADEQLVELVKNNEKVLTEAAIEVGKYPVSSIVYITEKVGTLDEPYEDIKGTFIYIPIDDEKCEYKAIEDTSLVTASNLPNVNHIMARPSGVVMFCKRVDFGGLHSNGMSGRGFFYSEKSDYKDGKLVYNGFDETFDDFEEFEKGYVAFGENNSYLYVEPITKKFFYYDFYEEY